MPFARLNGLESSSYGQLPPSLEVELLQLAAEGDVPVPEIHAYW